MAYSGGGTVTKIDHAERWMRDGLRVVESFGGCYSLLIDMSACAANRERLKLEGNPVKYASVIVCAAAKALSRHPKLQVLLAGNRKLSGSNIDVCISIAGDEIITPVVIVEDASHKTVYEIGHELLRKTPQARSEAAKVRELLMTWGWLVPFGFLRRQLLKFLLAKIWYRRRMSGTFQVTILPGLDFLAAQIFNTAAILAVGGIAERPLVVNGEVKARLTAPFTCSIDHKQWNGENAAIFLTELRTILEREADELFNVETRSLAAEA